MSKKKFRVRWLLANDLFTHREQIFEKHEDFYCFVQTWLKRTDEFKCMHIYFEKGDYEYCDEEQ